MANEDVALVVLVSVTWLCSILMAVVLLMLFKYTSTYTPSSLATTQEVERPQMLRYKLERTSWLFKFQAGIFAFGSIGTLIMGATTMTTVGRSSEAINSNNFALGNRLCSAGFRIGSVLFVLFHFCNYMFLMQKASASNAIPSNPQLGKLLQYSTYCVPLFAIAVAIVDDGRFDSDVPPFARTNADYFCTAYVRWEVAVTFGALDGLLEIGYFIYFLLPLRYVLQNFGQLKAALEYIPKNRKSVISTAEGEMSEKKRRLVAVTARNWMACCFSVVSTVIAVSVTSLANTNASVSTRMLADLSIPLNMLCCAAGSLYATKGAWRRLSSQHPTMTHQQKQQQQQTSSHRHTLSDA
eukprot:TRINITY_DN4509_c0_g2_i1.p1 TRINITY_DN4509_c0_g2~~TRINITY_DN4509_c0_g2_i1.p1  ORF type:complete len:353 (-),score=88.51 TRINITY_DN4509_c0_g2_i1:39-1097(-)